MNNRVLIVDDHEVFRLGIKMILIETGLLVDETNNESKFTRLITKFKYNLIILDYYLPNLNGERLFFLLQKHAVKCPVIFLTALESPQVLSRLLSYNINGILLKSSSLSYIKTGIIGVLNGQISIDQTIFSLINSSYDVIEHDHEILAQFSNLTEREIEVIQLIADGLINKEIGDKLNISKRTVDVHRNNILKKITAKSFCELVILAYKCNVIH